MSEQPEYEYSGEGVYMAVYEEQTPHGRKVRVRKVTPQYEEESEFTVPYFGYAYEPIVGTASAFLTGTGIAGLLGKAPSFLSFLVEPVIKLGALTLNPALIAGGLGILGLILARALRFRAGSSIVI